MSCGRIYTYKTIPVQIRILARCYGPVSQDYIRLVRFSHFLFFYHSMRCLAFSSALVEGSLGCAQIFLCSICIFMEHFLFIFGLFHLCELYSLFHRLSFGMKCCAAVPTSHSFTAILYYCFRIAIIAQKEIKLCAQTGWVCCQILQTSQVVLTKGTKGWIR